MRNDKERRLGARHHQGTARRIVAAGIALMACSAACTGGNSTDESAIARSDRAYEDARGRNDVAAINALLAPEYYAITSDGERRQPGNSGPVLAGPLLNGEARESSVINDHRIRIYGDTAVSTYNEHSVARGPDGGTRSTDLVRTNVWVRHSRQWRLALSHSTTVEK